MRFWTDYIWPEGESACGESLLLQQVRLGERSVLLAMIGREECENPIREWKNWFQEEGVYLCAKAEPERLERCLRERLEKMPVPSLKGILMAGENFCLMVGEGERIYLFNRMFQRTHVKMLSAASGEGCSVTCGAAEKGLGILLGSEVFYENVPIDLMKQCLASQDIVREKQIRSRLRELLRAGGGGGCAIYIRTV